MKRALVILALLAASACSKDNPTNPSPGPSPTPTPTPTVSLSGVVTWQGPNTRLGGATVTFLDGPNTGRAASTNANGEYRFDGVTQGNANLAATAPDYEEVRAGTFVNNSTLNFALRTRAPWRQDGNGNNVFDRPTYFNRIRIIGVYTAFSSNFIVRCGTQLVVNELLGTGWSMTRYEGVHQLNAGCNPIQITNSSGVVWNFIEER